MKVLFYIYRDPEPTYIDLTFTTGFALRSRASILSQSAGCRQVHIGV